MDTTSATLLERVRDRNDAAAWGEFHRIYSKLIIRYARHRGLGAADAEEIAQDCMKELAAAMPNFAYSREKGRFKAYVRAVASHRIGRWRRKRRPDLASLSRIARTAAPEAQDADWDRLWLREHLLYCLKSLETRADPQTVEAFRLYALEDWPVEDVCRKLDLTPNQVYLAKSRMTRRLHRAMRQLVGDMA